MSYFDDASLVFIPSGYKTSKAYSIKPTDGSGDLAFSRSNDTATRVNSAGLIEKVRTNLYPYGSNILTSHFPTSSGGATLTQGQTDPDAGTTAMRVQFASGATNFTYFAYATTPNLPLTRSVYIKGASAQTIQFADPSGTGGKNINITTSWARYDLAVAASGAGTYGVYFQNISDAAADFTIAFIQIETGDIATDYIVTTSAAVSVGPVANVPRLDYLNSSCPRLLLEPQRTNLATSSENLSGAGWSSQGSTITSNATTSPDGYSNADAIVETATTDEHNRIAITSLTAASHTASVFLKKFNQTWCAVYLFNGTVGIRHWINLDTLTAGTSANIGAGITAPLTLTNYGNGWVRASMTWTADATSWSFYIACARSNGGATTYAGDGTSGLYAWGAQVEAGAYATSYIPTLGAAVTRGADYAAKTSASALIGQSEGVVFVDFEVTDPAAFQPINIYNNNKAGNTISTVTVQFNVNTVVASFFFGNGTFDTITLTGGGYGLNQRLKVAFRYKSGELALYVNGVQKDTDSATYTANGTKSEIFLGDPTVYFAYKGGFKLYDFLQFPTSLTNAQLAELTTI